MKAGRRVGALGLAVALAWAASGCAELALAPELEAGGEPGAAVYIAAGVFEGRLNTTVKGTATYLLDDNGQAALALSSDFNAPAFPRIAVFLSHTAGLEQAARVGDLKSTTGAQRWTFKVPRGAVWERAILWSEELGVEVAHARLLPP